MNNNQYEAEKIKNNEKNLEIEESEDDKEELDITKLEDELHYKKYKYTLKNDAIELITISTKCKDLFFTQKEIKNNSNAYIIFWLTLIALFTITSFINIYILIPFLFTLFIICLFVPFNKIVKGLFKNSFTDIKYIKLKIDSTGIKITSDKKNRTSIFINSKDIADISINKSLYLKYQKKYEFKLYNDNARIGTNLILKLKTPINSIYNQKKFSKLILIEKIDSYEPFDNNHITETKELISKMKQILKINYLE